MTQRAVGTTTTRTARDTGDVRADAGPRVVAGRAVADRGVADRVVADPTGAVRAALEQGDVADRCEALAAVIDAVASALGPAGPLQRAVADADRPSAQAQDLRRALDASAQRLHLSSGTLQLLAQGWKRGRP